MVHGSAYTASVSVATTAPPLVALAWSVPVAKGTDHCRCAVVAVIVFDPSPAWIRSHVAAGHPVIVGMNLPSGGTHFVTLTGVNGASDYWVNDPWEQNAMHVTFSGDWFTRGPIYEAIAFI